MIKVSVLLADGFEEIEALTVVDLLRRAQIYVDTISIMEDYTVHGAHGINIQTEDLFEEVNFVESDMIVLPGGMPGTTNLNAHEGVRRVVKDFAAEGKPIAAICAAPTVLGNLGLLKGKRITCYPGGGDRDPRSGYASHTGSSGWQYYYKPGSRNGDSICSETNRSACWRRQVKRDCRSNCI